MSGEITDPYQGLPEQNSNQVELRIQEERSLLIPGVMTYFDEKQLLSSSRPIPAREVFEQRLETLAAGKPVELICFNCIDFTFQANGTSYPKARASRETDKALVACYQDEMTQAIDQLRLLGNPRVTIVVPDSELRNENVFNFTQGEKERLRIGESIREGLSRFEDDTTSAMLWSDFLESRGLPSAEEYTKNNLPLVMGKYSKSVKKMFGETEAYLRSKGMDQEEIKKINPAELTIRAAWYLAMYAGEGNAMADLASENNSGAIVLNFENDGKVLAWYQRGAQGTETTKEVLPIVTPADTRRFKLWKEDLHKKKEGVVYTRKRV